MLEKSWYLEISGNQAEFDEVVAKVFASAESETQPSLESHAECQAHETARNGPSTILPDQRPEQQIVIPTRIVTPSVRAETTALVENAKKAPFDFWKHAVSMALNNFKYKSLSNWACNVGVGCAHGCTFCSVPSTSTHWLAGQLEDYGVDDPDAQWGHYALVRLWDEDEFLASLYKAEHMPIADLKPDGNRAVIFCSTTDPYQVIRHSDPARQRDLNAALRFLMRRALELILDHSTLNVRVLTRSPLARLDFDLFKRFGDRLLFGMSLPTLNNELSRMYEPHSPAPTQRLATLRAAKAAGLNVYVAMAPTFPESDDVDLQRTLLAIKELDPFTIFHEPINIRAENVGRIEEHGRSLGVTLNTKVFVTRAAWRNYALGSLMMVERLAREMGLINRLHLWPDKDLGSKPGFLEMRRERWNNSGLNRNEIKEFKKDDELAYQQLHDWLAGWWSRISEWPGK